MFVLYVDKLIISSLIRHNALSEKSRFFKYFDGKQTNYIIDTLSFSKKDDLDNISEYKFIINIKCNRKLDEFFKRNKYCILKESTTNNALGIHIVSNIEEVLQLLKINPEMTDFVIQKYIDNPLLIKGLKFHIRVNVLVFGNILMYIFSFIYINYSYVHDNICCHVSTESFKLDNFDNSYIHITNYRINKSNPKFDRNIHLLGYKELCKMLGNERNGYDYWYNNLFKRICDMIEEIMEKIIKDKTHFFTVPNSFEIFGFDLILDDNENIYVLEVNNGPCLESECDEDVYNLVLNLIRFVKML